MDRERGVMGGGSRREPGKWGGGKRLKGRVDEITGKALIVMRI